MAWTRHGECNGCGFCCEMYTRAVVVRTSEQGDQAFYRARGFEPQMIDGQSRLVLIGWISAPCPHHVETSTPVSDLSPTVRRQCGIYADRPETCRAFPTLPVDVAGTPCSYWFENASHKIGGTGSPHPTTTADLLAIESL